MMNRRHFLERAASAGALAFASPFVSACERFGSQKQVARVAFVKTTDRAGGVSRAIDLLGLPSLAGKNVFIKPNFNSADAPPGSTHNETLAALLQKLRQRGAGPLTIGDRSGMGNTREVMEAKEIFRLAKDLEATTVVLDELPASEWELIKTANTHWSRGFAMPRPVLRAQAVVQTCCLKTHRFGGHFTLSLKNSVGLAAKFVPGDPYHSLRELHGSPHQRRMIAEINAAYRPQLIVLDGVEAFVTGGPESGKKVNAEVVLAGSDRVAIDAVGVALLRHFGTTPEVSGGAIFQQEQIARAAELKVGVSGPEQIDLITNDPASAAYAATIRNILNAK
jgi:uncharacterized protein (DUF362 family)